MLKFTIFRPPPNEQDRF